MMLFRQTLPTQDLHRVQHRFDALQPQFSNHLRASHNRQRRWTTQVCFGPILHNLGHANHQPHTPVYPDTSTPSSEHSYHASTPFAHPNQDFNDSSIHSAINLLNLYPSIPSHIPPNPFPSHPSKTRVIPNAHTAAPTPVNSLASSNSRPPETDAEEINHLLGSTNPSTQHTPLPHSTKKTPFSMRQSWMPPDSDTPTIMFNLDRLNDERLEIMQDQGWAKGCIPESPDSFIESLVQRVNRGRFRFELGTLSTGPSLIDPQIGSLLDNPRQPTLHANPTDDSQPNNLSSNAGELSTFELLTLGPGRSTQLQDLITLVRGNLE